MWTRVLLLSESTVRQYCCAKVCAYDPCGGRGTALITSATPSFYQVAHELLALQLLTVLLEEPTDDSVEIAVNFTKEIGQVWCSRRLSEA